MSSTDTPETAETADAADAADAAETADAAAPVLDPARDELLARLSDHLGEGLVGSHLAAGEDLTIRVTRDTWFAVAEFLKTTLGFQYFSFLSGIDWLPSPFGRDMAAQVDLELGHDEASEIDSTIETGLAGGDTRFQVFARVNDIVNGLGVTLKVDIPDSDLSVASWSGVYSGANWHERECWEMYGIDFPGHPGLRHIYLPSGFLGNPLRKDYPLLARRIKPWPGIVDVEQMPDSDNDAAARSSEGPGS